MEAKLKKLISTLTILTATIIISCAGNRDIADAIYYNAKVLTVDTSFTVAEAFAVKGNKFMAVGSEPEIMKHKGSSTQLYDLGGRTVIPGLIDGHGHTDMASISELEYPLPNPRNIQQLLDWLSLRVSQLEPGEWIIHPKLFFTRLEELRSPTLAELDSVAPENPVFLDGSYGGAINSAAMLASGIAPDTEHPGLLRDKDTGKLNGLVQYTAFKLLKLPEEIDYSVRERAEALAKQYGLYIKEGFTGVNNGSAVPSDTILYNYMRDNGMLSLRTSLNLWTGTSLIGLSEDELNDKLDKFAVVTGDGDEWLRWAAIKTSMDGGILTGTAYLNEPWGDKAVEIYGITDPEYRGLPKMNADQFGLFARVCAERGWKVTAHATGGGSVGIMLDGYEMAAESVDIKKLRCSIIHGNFYTPEAIKRCVALEIMPDVQAAWFYKDADAMLKILGERRIKTFNPYHSLIEAGLIINAGSDHMVILDPIESINPYSPWLAMWSMVTRGTERGSVIVPEEAISREDALRAYTMGNAYATFEENIKGSIEAGKLADFAVLAEDFMAIDPSRIKNMKVDMTVIDGKTAYSRKQ